MSTIGINLLDAYLNSFGYVSHCRLKVFDFTWISKQKDFQTKLRALLTRHYDLIADWVRQNRTGTISIHERNEHHY